MNKNFVVLRKHQRYDICGQVNSSSLFLQSVQVSLYTENPNNKERTLVARQKLNSFNFFDFVELKKANYIVKVETSIDLNLYNISSSQMEKNINMESMKEEDFAKLEEESNIPNRLFLNFNFQPQIKHHKQVSSGDSFYGLAFTILIGFLFFFRFQVIKAVEEYNKGNLQKHLQQTLFPKRSSSSSSLSTKNHSPNDSDFLPDKYRKSKK